ncbi:uncharacterized protein [Dermacentor albipictus]|uniref:uncharacterized protein isoform X3 n=1 Tax=Dermacentor albipictus TaxID=60249 RepID=UPI0038FC1CC3
MPLTAGAPVSRLWCPPPVPITPGPVRATLASRKYRPLQKTPREVFQNWGDLILQRCTSGKSWYSTVPCCICFMRTPGVTRGTRKPRRLPKKLATSMVLLTMAALVTGTWGPSAASKTQGPEQAVLAWRMHQPVLKTAPRMLLEPEKGNSKRPALPVERFPADGTPYPGKRTNTRVIQPPLSEHVINHVSRSRATNAKHVVNC